MPKKNKNKIRKESKNNTYIMFFALLLGFLTLYIYLSGGPKNWNYYNCDNNPYVHNLKSNPTDHPRKINNWG